MKLIILFFIRFILSLDIKQSTVDDKNSKTNTEQSVINDKNSKTDIKKSIIDDEHSNQDNKKSVTDDEYTSIDKAGFIIDGDECTLEKKLKISTDKDFEKIKKCKSLKGKGIFFTELTYTDFNWDIEKLDFKIDEDKSGSLTFNKTDLNEIELGKLKTVIGSIVVDSNTNMYKFKMTAETIKGDFNVTYNNVLTKFETPSLESVNILKIAHSPILKYIEFKSLDAKRVIIYDFANKGKLTINFKDIDKTEIEIEHIWTEYQLHPLNGKRINGFIRWKYSVKESIIIEEKKTDSDNYRFVKHPILFANPYVEY